MEDGEKVERYIILFLGVIDKPIPSITHFEKEIFILSNFKEMVKEFFLFQKHYYGPFSQELKDSIEEPSYFSNAWTKHSGRIEMTELGKKIFRNILKENKGNERFNELIESIKMIRKIYEKLTVDELLFLIYVTYPDYKTKSEVFDKLYFKRDEISLSLLKKGLITQSRYEELRRMK